MYVCIYFVEFMSQRFQNVYFLKKNELIKSSQAGDYFLNLTPAKITCV